MNDQKKLVSIGLPIYNGANRVTRALGTLLAQTYKNFELIISDNASTDDTESVCRSYAAKDVRIKYIRQKENLGHIGNLYFLLKEAKGEYFMWVADDDWWNEKYIEKLVDALDKNPDYGVAQSSFDRILTDGSFYERVLFVGDNNITGQGYYEVLKKFLIVGFGMNHYIYGIFRRGLLAKFVEKPLWECLSWERVFMSEVALSTNFYSVEEVLRYSGVRRNKKARPKISYHSLRYSGDKKRPIFFMPYAFTRMLWNSFKRCVASRVVPLRRKFFIFIPFMQIVWDQRKRYIGFSWRDFEKLFRKMG